ncbi:protein dachsous-like [Saccostrea cucullata]|uniref:protein dachsous-like n=1 Tax=Saccostrea cuccullata TaxID=36930 RepID=UPI002ED03C35
MKPWNNNLLLLLLSLVAAVRSQVEVTLKFDVIEEQAPLTYVGQINVTAYPPPYTLLQSSDDISLDIQSGLIRTARKLDRETKSSYEIVILSMHSNGMTTIQIKINVIDTNDNVPYFPSGSKSLSLSEMSPNGSKVHIGSVKDRDIGINSVQNTATIISGNQDNMFKLESRLPSATLYLDLVLNGKLDYDSGVKEYSLIIQVSDGGVPRHTANVLVNVSVIDANDNAPEFTHTKYSTVVPESIQIGTSIVKVSATDIDSGENGKITYLLDRQRDPEEHFIIEQNTGIIRINKQVDYERQKHYELSVIARDNGSQTLESNAVVEVNITNVNEQPANINLVYLIKDNKTFENATVGDYIARISVSDPDSPNNYYANVNVTLQGDMGYFGLVTDDRVVYRIKILKPLDRESYANYNLTITAEDSGPSGPPLYASKSFTLIVEDVNDNAPKFTKTIYSASVPEQAPAGSTVVKVTASDPDLGENARITYSIISNPSSDADWFQIDSSTGLITTKSSSNIDCEHNSNPWITVIATDHGSPPQSSTATVSIAIDDVNDLEPVFERSYYEGRVAENVAVGSCILTVSANDPDCQGRTQNLIQYRLDNTSVSQNFNVNATSGQICVRQALDFETKQSHEFTVFARDAGNLESSAVVKVSLTDVNDNHPEFYPQNYSINVDLSEAQAGTTIVRVQAQDPDSGSYGSVQYSITAGNDRGYFSITTNSGRIYLASSLPSEEKMYTLEVTGTDDGGLTSKIPAHVYVSITGQNSHPPVFGNLTYSFSVPEDTVHGTTVGTIHATVQPINGVTPVVKYSIASGDKTGLFAINDRTGVISSTKSLDHETQPFVLLSIRAEAGDPPVFGTAQVNITVSDVNDNSPQFQTNSLQIPVWEDEDLSTTLYTAHATDPDSGENGTVFYSLQGDSSNTFRINPTSGEITLQKALDYEQVVMYHLHVEASDQGKAPRTSTLNLTIKVLNVNDNSPVFSASQYVFNVSESAAVQSNIDRIQATDLDGDIVSYSLRDSMYQNLFGIDSSTGYIFLKQELNREEKDSYILTVIARDNGKGYRSTAVQVTINVIDANDHSPVFKQSFFTFYILENMAANTLVGQTTATDKDTGDNAYLLYQFEQPEPHLRIDPVSGVITIASSLDREDKDLYNLTVIASDHGDPKKYDYANVKILVGDLNDNSPTFLNSQPIEALVSENEPKGTSVLNISAKDDDALENGTISFSLTADGDAEALKYFAIHPKSGLITTLEVLDYEKKNRYVMGVVAEDHGNPARSTSSSLVINVKDENDGKPIFSSQNVTIKVVENIKTGSIVGRVEAKDWDSGENGRISYSIIGGNVFDVFAVNVSTGDIYCIRNVDYEEASSHSLAVKAVDNSPYIPKSSTISVEIEVEDTNDNPPVFDKDPVLLHRKENLPIGYTVYTFTATDKDSGLNGTIRYSIQSQTPDKSLFTIDPQTGDLKVAAMLDYEVVKQVSLVIQAEDRCHVGCVQKATVTAWLYVIDVNDNNPVFKGNSSYSVFENETVGPTGYPVTHIIATDADSNVDNSGNGVLAFSIIGGNDEGHFAIDRSSGLLVIQQTLDRETTPSYTLTIQVQDQGTPQRSAVKQISVHVLDINDHAPQFSQSTYTVSIPENSSPQQNVLQLTATDLDIGENGRLSFYLPPGVADDKFQLNPTTGQLSTTASLDREEQAQYVLTAYVRDFGYPEKYSTTRIVVDVTDVNDNVPVFVKSEVSLSIPENTKQEAIHQLVAKDADAGDNARLSYAIIGGNIGGAFTIDPETGELSCKALDRETIASYNLTIRASDHGSPQRNTMCQVHVKVLDKNDNFPEFSALEYAHTIKENVALGTFVLQVAASDIDEGENARITYSLGNDTDGFFQVDSQSGNITTNGLFDYEKKTSYVFYVVAKDGGQKDIKNKTVQVRINLSDVNDNAPIFKEMAYRKNVSINTPADTFVVKVQADDKDSGINGEVRYALSNSGTDLATYNMFRIDEVSGNVYTRQTLTTRGVHMIQVVATDLGAPALSSTGIIEVTVGDNAGSVSLRFDQTSYHATIEEGSPKYTSVTTVRATYVGSGSGPITYSLVNSKDQQVFSLDSSTGRVTVNNGALLDFEVAQEVHVMVVASSGSLSTYTQVVVQLTDKNDNAPKFAQNVYYSSTWEGEKGDHVYVTQVLATDADSGINSDITYNIIGGNEGYTFQIHPPHSGIVVTTLPLDYEIQNFYSLTIEAVDQGRPSQSSTCTLNIDVVDINDQYPTFPEPQPVNLSEAADIGSLVRLVTANDRDRNPTLLYDFTPNGNPGNTFAIDRFSGRVTLAKPLDHEIQRNYAVGLTVNDTKYSAQTTLNVNVKDENDNHPVFLQQSYKADILEFTGSGVKILTVNATDADTGVNAVITYNLIVNPTGGFYIDPNTGEIYTNKTVELRQDQQVLTLVVTAQDGGTPRLSAVVAINLQIIPVNQYAPEFPPQQTKFSFAEDIKKGENLWSVTASDRDMKQEVYYSIRAGNQANSFGIDRQSGLVFLNENLDRESMPSYSLIIEASDNGNPVKKNTIGVSVEVIDVNDQSPVFKPTEYFKELPENMAHSNSFLQVLATDSDAGINAEIQYTITSGNDQGLFIVHGKTGVVSITPNATLDYENTQQHKLIVRATDCLGCDSSQMKFSAFATIVINVTDVNEYPPLFPVPFYYASVNEGPRDTKVFQAHANDKDGGKYGVLSYRIQNTNVFRIDSITGWVYTNMDIDYENLPYLSAPGEHQYKFDLTVTDLDGLEDTKPVIVTINDVDEFSPVFTKNKYAFDVPGNAKKGHIIGKVGATDDDGGLAGMVFYVIKSPVDYFDVNITTGEVYVSHDFHSDIRSKRDTFSRQKRALDKNFITLIITATNGAEDLRASTAIVEVSVDTECAGCALPQPLTQEDSVNTTIIAIVVVFVLVAIILVVIIVIIVIRFRKRKAPTVVYETEYPHQFDFPVASDDGSPPAYDEKYRNHPITPDISERSHHSQSSGRGSVEADEDEEIMMINSHSSVLNNSAGFRSKNMPDSGIQDDDNMSEPSVQNSKDYLARLGIEPVHTQIKTQNIMQSVESMHQFTEEGGGEDVEYNNDSSADIVISDSNNDLGFHEPDVQQHVGALSSVINSEEEYSGSYNWDYLLDWGPQYQPLAHVFTEIARLKDDKQTPKKQPVKTVPQRKTTINLNPQVKMDPPPIITNAPPKSVQQSQGSKHSSRTNSTMNVSSLPSLPRSPISYESSFTSPAITPSYTPSLTPLATRSPSISPYGSGHNTPNRQRTNGHMQRMALSSESEQELRI